MKKGVSRFVEESRISQIDQQWMHYNEGHRRNWWFILYGIGRWERTKYLGLCIGTKKMYFLKYAWKNSKDIPLQIWPEWYYDWKHIFGHSDIHKMLFFEQQKEKKNEWVNGQMKRRKKWIIALFWIVTQLIVTAWNTVGKRALFRLSNIVIWCSCLPLKW